MRKILLNNHVSKTSVNNTNVIPVELNRDASLFQNELLTDTVDTIQIYNDEKDKSTKHRFIFTLYPICSNALFNNITEVVYKEGSNDAQILSNYDYLTLPGTISTEYIGRIQAIRNTEYSNAEYELNYHCGVDIFNNHLLRNKENVSVQKRGSSAKKICEVYDGETNEKLGNFDPFNSIGDYIRNHDGNEIVTYLPRLSNNYVYSTGSFVSRLPLYLYDTINSFSQAYSLGLKRKDGWFGFNNPTTLRIPVSGDSIDGYFINKCMNNNEGCEFVQLSPEKDLFNFTPKKNPYRQRLEYNWDYCLTYPYKNIYDDGQILLGKGNGLPLIPFSVIGGSSIPYKTNYGINGLKQALFRSAVKHNLSIGDLVNIKFSHGEEIRCSVVNVGDENKKGKEYYFSIRLNDLDDIEIADGSVPSRFVKVVNGFECDYYYRKFKKFDGKHHSNLTRLAFANTIYGDEVAQIVYTDDFDISQYRDNLNRPLTEVYLTILKANRGYRLWYNRDIANDSSIEYSHVFGKVTSGLDLPPFVGKEYPSIRKQHNIDIGSFSNYDITIPNSSVFLEEDITNEEWDEFLGDLVEFNPVTVMETTLQVVKHRFNTAQRECNNDAYTTLYHDEIKGDIYDVDVYGKNNSADNNRISQYKVNEGYANIAPEGYIYTPHHKVKIGEFSDIIQQLSDTTIEVYDGTLSRSLNFRTEKNYGILPNDIVSIYSKTNNEVYQYIVESYVKIGDFYVCVATLARDNTLPSLNLDDYIVLKNNLEVPDYAYMLPDGTGRHIWRDIIKPSALSYQSDLYNTPFTNNAFYHHNNITFPVTRQDPFGTYKMQVTLSGEPLKNNFEIPGNEIDLSGSEYIFETENTSCF